MFHRLISDLRDLWTLITKGPPVDDPFLPWRMAADLAKFNATVEDIDAWEGKMYAVPGNFAFWFAHDRYAGTPFDWPKRNRGSAIHGVGSDLIDYKTRHSAVYAGSLFTVNGVRLDDNDRVVVSGCFFS